MLEESNQQIPPVGYTAARDTFVADTAVKIHHLQAAIERLERDAEVSRSMLIELREAVDQNQRFYTFQQGERRAKESRLDEALQCWKVLKARLALPDADESGSGAGSAQLSHETIERRLTALEDGQGRIERSRLNRRSHALLVAVVAFVVFGTVYFMMT